MSTVSKAIKLQSKLTISLSNSQLENLLKIQQLFMSKLVANNDQQQALQELCHTAESICEAEASVIMLDKSDYHSAPENTSAKHSTVNVSAINNQAFLPTSCVQKDSSKPKLSQDNDLTFGKKKLGIHLPSALEPQYSEASGYYSAAIYNECEQKIGVFALCKNDQPLMYRGYYRRLAETCAHLAGALLQRETAESNLWQLAHHDILTGLPNRRLFDLRLDHAITKAKRAKQYIAIFFIDLDHFKVINDTFGHDAGDTALRETSARIKACIRDEDTLARIGGDEFILMIENITEPHNVHRISENIHQVLSKNLLLNQERYRLSVSIGISFYPQDGTNNRSLLECADTALYSAKAQGRSCSVYYDAKTCRKI